ncbi:MAG: hypothetical protein GF353_27485 [Candidatus Lokiarchaeota archaeon]|nr:hypothetical protein [Candidatus Lokiarchaeota archaeon]
MSNQDTNLNIRQYLAKKLLTICPICGKRIYGKDIDLEEIEKLKKKIHHWPIKYIHCHSQHQIPLHAITLYIDADFAVRGNEVSKFVKIQLK